MTPRLSRRNLLVSSVAAASAAVLQPVRSLAAAVKPIRIVDVELFDIDIPVSKAEHDAGVNHEFSVAKIATDAGVDGYSFAGSPRDALPDLRQILVGKDLFAIEQHLRNGLYHWGGTEHAIWDAIGKIAGQPVYRLLGGSQQSIRPYLTCVWRGNPDQSHVSYRQQAEMALRIKKAGFKGMKIRAWRPRPLADVEACAEIRAAVGPDFYLMFDRTAHFPETVGQKVWDYETGLAVAQGLEKYGAYWLEEPFGRDDYQSNARLAAVVEILITGGEGYIALEPFRQCILQSSYKVLQPEGVGCGGIFMCRKVAIMAEGFHVRCILHGTMALMLAGYIQASLAFGAEWQELALITPPLLPEEQWAPALRVLKSKQMFTIEGGEIQAPLHPGIGLDIDEEALRRFRVNRTA
jgi:D-galactarolactone cycloisomerase